MRDVVSASFVYFGQVLSHFSISALGPAFDPIRGFWQATLVFFGAITWLQRPKKMVNQKSQLLI